MTKSKKRIQSYLIDIEKIVGKGSFGEIYLCQHQITQESFIAKVINKNKIDSDQYMKNAFKQQVIIQNSLKHNNIVKLIEVFETDHNYYIIQEYCQNGNLRQLLNTHHRLSQQDALHCLHCLCLGFTQISKNGVIHRDLKPQNILIKQNDLKITDFGFAKKMMNFRQLTKTSLGTPFYMAPQLLKGEKYSSKCDIWSVGIIFYQLLYGIRPWEGKTVSNLLSNIQSHKLYFDPKISVSEQSQIFLIETLQVQENQRLSWLEVFEHRIWKLLSPEQNQFYSISLKWRVGYNRAAEKLNKIAEKVQIKELITAFLQLQMATLSFDQFKKIILWLLNVNDDEDVGIMYELFDKDCNGVIDFEQFMSSFGFGQEYKSIIKMLRKLLQSGSSLEDLKKEKQFMNIAKSFGIDESQAKEIYSIILSIEL